MRKKASIPHRDLLDKIEAYCRETGVSETAFGKTAVHDPNLVRDIRGGRELRRATLAKIEAAMPANQAPP